GTSVLDGGRTLQLNGASTTSGTSVGISLNATNPSTGLSDVGSGTLTILSGATFTDATTGALTISTANRGVADDGTAAVMNNAGTFTKTGGGTSPISIKFNNTGTVDVQSGTLNLSGGGVDTGATYTTTTGNGILQFGGGTRTLNNTSQITAANVTFSGSQTTTVSGTYNVAGTTTVSGGTATLTGTLTGLGNALVITGGTLSIGSSTASVATFTQSGGELTGSAVVTVTGPTVGVATASNFSGGTQSGSGTTIAQHGATFSGNSGLDGGRTLQLNGASTTSGTSVGISLNATNPSTGLSDVGSGTLTILSGATFTDATTGTLTISTANRGVADDGTAAVMNNAGTFTKTDVGTSTISVPLSNTGIVDVQAGTLVFGGSVTNSGTLHADGGTIKINTAIGGGNALIDGSTLEYVLASGEAVTFGAATGGTLKLDLASQFTGTLAGFRAQE